MSSIKKLSSSEIISAVERLSNETIKILSDLVRFQSYANTPQEIQAQHYVADLLSSWGLSTKLIPVPAAQLHQHPGFSPVDWSYPQERVNVVGTWTPKTSKGKSLAINGHIDVVPVEEATAAQWTNGPFEPTVRDGRLYGRGAGDMKGGFVAGLIAFRALRELGYNPAGRVEFHSVIEEECTGNGALAVVLDDGGSHCADAVLIPEPLPGILSAQLGVMWCTVSVTGKPVHVLDTAAGINAIEGCFQLWHGLKALEEHWNSEAYRAGVPGARPYSHMQHPINFNLGVINGGAWASSVPSASTITFRVGFFPGLTVESVRAEIEKNLSATAQAFAIHHQVSYSGFQALGVDLSDLEGSQVGRVLANAVEEVTGEPAKFTPATCTTDCRAYAKFSPNATQVTCYGPEAKNIHGIDESVSLASINNVASVYALFISEHCQLEPIESSRQL